MAMLGVRSEAKTSGVATAWNILPVLMCPPLLGKVRTTTETRRYTSTGRPSTWPLPSGHPHLADLRPERGTVPRDSFHSYDEVRTQPWRTWGCDTDRPPATTSA